MGNLAYSVTSNRPRTILNVADWAALANHGNYGTIDPTFRTRLINEATTIATTDTATICRNSSGTGSPRDDIHKKMLTLCAGHQAVGALMPAGTLLIWRLKAQDVAAYIANTLIPLNQWGTNSRRSSTLALAYVLDLLYSYHSAGQISTMGSAIITLCDDMSLNQYETFDGHTAGDQACAFIAAAALYGESGFTSGASNAATPLQDAIDYWWGGNATLVINGEARLNFNRYFCSGGGHGKSVWYSMLEGWYTSLILQCASNALTSMTINGEAYALPSSETWINSLGEWFVNFACRGDLDYWHIQGDTDRVTNPWFHEYESTTLAYLIRNSAAFRGALRSIYDRKLQKTFGLNQNPVYNRIADYCLFDPGSATYAPVDPSSVPVATSKLMNPPGIYVYRNNWDLTGDRHCAIVVEAQNYFWRGHSSDLKCGSIAINVQDDMVLLNRGFYSTSSAQTDIADFGGTYTNNFVRQSISASGVPLVDDFAVTATASPNWRGTPHTDQNFNGTSTPYPHGQGGQLFKYDYTIATSPPTPNDPYTITRMTSEGTPTGSRWRRVIGIDGDFNKGLEIQAETNDLVFLTADLRWAYVAREDHYGTANDRLETCTLKMIVIKNEGNYPCVFRVAKVRARQSSYVKRDVWNFYGDPNIASFNTTGRFFASGYRAVEQSASAKGGKCLIAYHNFASYRCDKVGDSSATYTGTGANHHAYTVGGTSTLQRFPLGANPSTQLGGRQFTDLGRWRVEIRPLTQQQDDTFVNLIVPLGPNDVEPDFTLFESATHWCVRFGGESSERVYKIHKTTVAYEGPTDPLDDIAPAAPTGVAAVAGPASGQVTVSWNRNTEPDYRKARVSYRVKV